jgi:trans-aconitate 2-methyltransferase
MSKWDPKLYLTFERERTQPSIDLVRRIDVEAPKRVIDIGCGPGNSTVVLKSRWPDAEIVGLDNSETMINQARKNFSDIKWVQGDAGDDLTSLGTFDVVFSNATIQWIPNQALLLKKLYNLLTDTGILAVQVPCTKNMPIHLELQKLIASSKWKEQFTTLSTTYSSHMADYYYNILCELTSNIELWVTDYYHNAQSPQLD